MLVVMSAMVMILMDGSSDVGGAYGNDYYGDCGDDGDDDADFFHSLSMKCVTMVRSRAWWHLPSQETNPLPAHPAKMLGFQCPEGTTLLLASFGISSALA